jgi:hypothetical protein
MARPDEEHWSGENQDRESPIRASISLAVGRPCVSDRGLRQRASTRWRSGARFSDLAGEAPRFRPQGDPDSRSDTGFGTAGFNSGHDIR